jgi:capsular exopolysaccharide synthesis family protein
MAQYDVTLRDYWRIIRKRKLYILFATVMLGLTSFATAYYSKPVPRFQAETKVQYERAQSAEEAYTSALSGSDDLETQQAVIRSYELVERIAHEMKMIDTLTATEEQRINAINSLRGQIVTSVEGLTNIISVSITDGDRYFARDLANTVAEVYQDYNHEVRNAKLLNSRKFIRGQRQRVTESLSESQTKLREFQERTQIISINAATGQALNDLRRERERQENLKTLQMNLERLLSAGENVQEGDLTSFPPEEGGPRFAERLGKLQNLNQSRNQMLVNYTDQHPAVVNLDNLKRITIRDMQAALEAQRDVIAKRVDFANAEVDTLEKRFRELPTLGIELEELSRGVQIQGNLLENIEQQYQQSLIDQSEEVNEITILQPALLPRDAINPSTPRAIAGVGALLGLIIGVVAAFIAETLDTSIGTIEDVEEYLEVPVVGIIPQMDIESMQEAMEERSGGPVDIELVERRLRLSTHFEPQSTLAESYRALRTNIQFANLEKGAKVICLTSSSHQEGKSTTSANLAVTLAQAGNRVLLVDGDLRRPTINRIFGLEREPGITDVILGNYTWREVVRTVTDIMVGGLGMDDIMMTAGMDNLNIITCGVLPPNPAEITDSRRMTEFLQEAKEAYDVVIVDAPPVLQATDATVLGTKVDGVLMVYKIGNVSRSALRRAKLQLDNVGVTTLGVVINGLRADVSEDFKDLRYYSYYTYGSNSDEESGPALVRFYKRSKRQIEQSWKQTVTQFAPYVEMVKERLPVGGFFGSDIDEEDHEPDITSKILSVSFWVFLAGFLIAGILWQAGYLRPGGTVAKPMQIETPDPASPITPSESPGGSETPSPQEQVKPVQESQPATPAKEDSTRSEGSKAQRTILMIAETAVDSVSSTSQINADAPETRVHHAPTRSDKAIAVSHSKPARSSGNRYALHVSSHSIESSANRDAKALRSQGYAVQIVRTSVPNKGIFHRILIGEFSTKAEARSALADVKASLNLGFIQIVPYPGVHPTAPMTQTANTP